MDQLSLLMFFSKRMSDEQENYFGMDSWPRRDCSSEQRENDDARAETCGNFHSFQPADDRPKQQVERDRQRDRRKKLPSEFKRGDHQNCRDDDQRGGATWF